MTTSLGVGLGVVFTAILFTDTLCPEHRAWVQLFATLALVGTVFAAVGLIRRWAMAPFLTLVVTLCGTAIGVLDAAHAPGRGGLIAAAFAVLATGASVIVVRQIALLGWDRSVRKSLASEPAPELATDDVRPEPVPHSDHAVVTGADAAEVGETSSLTAEVD